MELDKSAKSKEQAPPWAQVAAPAWFESSWLTPTCARQLLGSDMVRTRSTAPQQEGVAMGCFAQGSTSERWRKVGDPRRAGTHLQFVCVCLPPYRLSCALVPGGCWSKCLPPVPATRALSSRRQFCTSMAFSGLYPRFPVELRGALAAPCALRRYIGFSPAPLVDQPSAPQAPSCLTRAFISAGKNMHRMSSSSIPSCDE